MEKHDVTKWLDTWYHDDKTCLCCLKLVPHLLICQRGGAFLYGMEPRRGEDGSPIFDNLDIDLFVKVLANTVFSKSYCHYQLQSLTIL